MSVGQIDTQHLLEHQSVKYEKGSFLAGPRFPSSTFVECEQIGSELFSMEIPLVPGSKKLHSSLVSFRQYPIYTVSDVALSAQLENICALISLLVSITARTRFFYRVKRFTSAIDVALDTRSLLFVRNKISLGNGKGERMEK